MVKQKSNTPLWTTYIFSGTIKVTTAGERDKHTVNIMPIRKGCEIWNTSANRRVHFCPYRHTTITAMKGGEYHGTDKLLALVTELRGLRNVAAELADEIDTLEYTLKAEMTNLGVDKLYIGDCKVTWTEYNTSKFDTKTFKAEHANLYGEYTKTVKARRFSVS